MTAKEKKSPREVTLGMLVSKDSALAVAMSIVCNSFLGSDVRRPLRNLTKDFMDAQKEYEEEMKKIQAAFSEDGQTVSGDNVPKFGAAMQDLNNQPFKIKTPRIDIPEERLEEYGVRLSAAGEILLDPFVRFIEKKD